MSLLKTGYPDLDVAVTERMLWGTAGADRIARYMRSWSTIYVAWVTMLDQNRDAQQYGAPDTTPLIDTIPPKTAGTYVWTPSTPPAMTSDAYNRIQAEAYSDASGVAVGVTADTTGGEDIGSLSNGDWAEYPNVIFGARAATQFTVRVASGAAGGVSGRIEVRLDSLSSTPVGSITVENTGGWQTWTTKTADISGVTGTHTVYLTFTSDQSDDLGNVNWFTFAR
ncbi:carbohydrate-binding protein [Streptomyces canus]|uniref:carbohydrate-binding protein n=1 Tax=Streptomyces canus TaxID=58343 RepID=UPI0036CE8B4A